MRKEVKVVMKSFKKETKNLTKKTTDNINFEVSKGFLKRNKEERQKFVNEMKTYIDTKVEVYNESLEEIFLNYNNELDEIGLTIMETNGNCTMLLKIVPNVTIWQNNTLKC